MRTCKKGGTKTDYPNFYQREHEQASADKKPFCLTSDRKSDVVLSSVPLTLSAFVLRINRTVDGKHMELLKTADLESALLAQGFLAYGAQPNGALTKLPTKDGMQKGFDTMQKPLVGGGAVCIVTISRAAQAFVLSHLNAFLGLDAALDQEMPRKAEQKTNQIAQKPKEPLETNTQTTRAKYDYCWNCNAKVAYRFTFKCDTCGWPICPKCGACRAPRSGYCAEGKKGLARFTGILKYKNEMRAQLLRQNLLDYACFSDLCEVSSPKAADEFRKKYADKFEHLDTLAAERRREKEKESAEKIAELKRNEKGFFKIVTKTARFITYKSANGTNKTVPNRPPVRVGTNYVDLSALPKEEW